ncbi:hypothetical protein [Prevotella sp.]
MALTIHLFVHGVPAGKKQWGKFCKEDQLYLDQFYQGDIQEECMKVECRNIAGSPSVFYTFIIGKNINACDGRKGSYFALTLKMNSYYRDIQNIYAILKAAYHKYCMGLLLTDCQNFVKFSIPNFQNKNEELLALEKSISDYLSNFSHDSDIKPLDKQMLVVGKTKSICLSDCDAESALQLIRANGSILVSEFYASFREQKREQLHAEELKSAQTRYAAEINKIEASFQQTLNDLRHQFESEKSKSAKREKEQLNALNRRLVETEEKLGKAQKTCNDYKSEIENYRQKFHKASELLHTTGLDAVPTPISPPTPPMTDYPDWQSNQPKRKSKTWRKRIPKTWRETIQLLLPILIVGALCILYFTVHGVGTDVDKIREDIQGIATQVEEQQSEIGKLITSLKPQKKQRNAKKSRK